ncbi:MAG: hypothetical protein ACREXY_21200 [Gammaproteobacteria bacterium]
MKKLLLFASVLCGTLAAAPAMGEGVSADFHALSAMSSPVPAMTETQMSSVEGGQLEVLSGLLGQLPVLNLLSGLPLGGLPLGGLSLGGLPLGGLSLGG